MDRGFNFLFQGNRSNFGGQNVPDYRERADQSDRRYDDFYGNNNNMNNNQNNMNRFGNSGGGQMHNRGGGAAGNWNNPSNQMGFPNQGGPNPGGMNGPMLSAMQQQNILNALMSTQGGKGLLAQQNPNMHTGQQNRPRFNRRGGGGGTRPGDKRKNDNAVQAGFNNKQGRKPQQSNVTKKKVTVPPKEAATIDNEEEPKAEEIDIPDEEVVVPDSLMESVEKLRKRSEIKRNVADEDVEKLQVFCFTGKGYQCKTCGLLLMREPAFADHLMHKNHVMKVIDARTAKKYQEVRDILDVDLTTDDWFEKSEVARAIIMKQSKIQIKVQRELKEREAANYNKTPSNFFNFNMELRKSVVKKDEEVVITSVVESTVAVKDFTGEKFFGCEFVRAVTGFHCRLCSINIREAKGVIPHIDSKQHKTNYATYIRKNREYEKTQKEQNQDLFDIMSQHEGKSVVLAESANVEGSQFLSLLDSELVRIPSVMKPELKKDKEKEKEAAKIAEVGEEKTADEGVAGPADKDAETAEDGNDGEVAATEAEGFQEEMESTEQNGEGNEADTEEPAEVDQDEADEAADDENQKNGTVAKTDKVPPKRGKGRPTKKQDDAETVADDG